MYIITATNSDGAENIFHDSDGNDPEFLILEGTLTMEFNKSGTMNFKVSRKNVGLVEGWFNKLTTIIRCYKKVDRVWKFMWKGRILDTSKDFIGSTVFNCEGWLSCLCDSVVRPDVGSQWIPSNDKEHIVTTPANLFNALITSHNNQVENSKKFASVHIKGFPSTTVKFPVAGYESTMDYIQSNFLENEDVGGMLWLGRDDKDAEALFYYSDDANNVRNGEQEIVFGENLLDLTEAIDASEVYTVVIPTGKDDIKLTTNGYSSKDYVENSTGINLFGRIVRQMSYSDISTPAALATKATEELKKSIVAATTLDISAFDLSLINSNISTFEVGTMVRVISPAHDFDGREICRQVSIDLTNPANTRYTLGVDPQSMTRKQTSLSTRITGNARYTSEAIREVNRRIDELPSGGGSGGGDGYYLAGPDDDFILDTSLLDTGTFG